MPHQILEESVFPKSSKIVTVLAQSAELLRHPRNGRRSVFPVCDALARIYLNDHVPTPPFHMLLEPECLLLFVPFNTPPEALLRETTNRISPIPLSLLISPSEN